MSKSATTDLKESTMTATVLKLARRIQVFGLEIDVPRNTRRFAIVSARPTDLRSKLGTYVAFASIDGSRSDADAALKVAKTLNDASGPGCSTMVIDLTDGLVVA